jgi:RNA polymerase sigma factor (sigma-70 family)
MGEVRQIARRGAIRAGANRHEADDVAQDIALKFFRLWHDPSIVRARSGAAHSWGAFIARSARNRHLDLIRSARKRQEREAKAFIEVPHDSGGPDAYLARLEIVEAIERLKRPRHQQCAELIWVRGMSIRQAAEILDIEPQTVRLHLREARRELRKMLGGEPDSKE